MRRVIFMTAAICAATPAFATTSLMQQAKVGVSADLDGSPTAFSSSSTSFGFSAGLGAGTDAVDENVLNGEFIKVYADSFGSWASEDSGSLRLKWGWDLNSTTESVAETNKNLPNWTYQFIASGNGSITFNGTVTATGDALFGLQPIYVGGDGGGIIGGDVFDPNGSDILSFALVSGQTYTFTLGNFGNVNSIGGLHGKGDAVALVDWKIAYDSAVPEPASWMMMIAGFGLAGVAMRRSKRAIAFA
jgi:hypothetical protein